MDHFLLHTLGICGDSSSHLDVLDIVFAIYNQVAYYRIVLQGLWTSIVYSFK